MSKIKYADPTMPLEERCERLNLGFCVHLPQHELGDDMGEARTT